MKPFLPSASASGRSTCVNADRKLSNPLRVFSGALDFLVIA